MTTKAKKITAISAAVIIASIATAVIISNGDKGPDLSGQSPEEIRDYFKSEEFQGMDQEEKRQVAQKAFQPMRQQMAQKMHETAKTYAELPTEQKVAFLDEQIDEMQERMKEFRKRMEEGGQNSQSPAMSRPPSPAANSGSNTSTPPPGGRGPTPDRIRGRMEQMDPQARAYMAQFMEDMMKRMEQRGIEMPFGPRGAGRPR
jgi:hypothetical protein